MGNELYQMVIRQKAELAAGQTVVMRDVLPTLQQALDSPLVKVLVGPRRCGKSTLAKVAMRGLNSAYLNFEDEGFPHQATGDEILAALTRAYPGSKYIFFDEVQNFPRWEAFLHRLHREGYNCLVTGSNAHLLSRELATALTGRHIELKLLPFSYREIIGSGLPDTEATLMHYLTHGGFPEVVVGQADVHAYLGALWDSIVLRDVVRRYKIRNVRELHDLYTLVLHCVASRFSNDSLVRGLGGAVSAPTVKKFLMYGHQAYLFAELSRFHFGARKRLKFDRKFYVYDTGFLTAKKLASSPDYGHLLENLVFVELVRRGFEPNMSLFYYVTRAGYEVDFVTRAGIKNVELIQVAWTMREQKTRDRELRSLAQAAAELKVESIRILTLDQADEFQFDGVRALVQPVRQWLLEEPSTRPPQDRP